VKGYTHETVRNRRLEAAALRALAEAVELAVEGYDEGERQDALSAQMGRARVAPAADDADDDADADDGGFDDFGFGRDAHFGSGRRR
jgi:hypothetical protein